MNVLHKVTLRSLKRNRVRTLVTVVGIVLSAAMICAVTTFASSLQNYAVRASIYENGDWHGSVQGEPYSVYAGVKSDKAVERTAVFQELGYAVAEGCQNEFKPYIYLLGEGEGARGTLPVRLSSGRYPKNPGEILLPDHLYDNGGVEHFLGDKLTLALGSRVLNGDILTQQNPCYTDANGESVFNGETLSPRETREYTVVGFYERLSRELEPTTSPGYTAFTVADAGVTSNTLYTTFYTLKKPREISSFMRRHGISGTTNSNLLRAEGVFGIPDISVMVGSLAAIVIALIVFGSVALIYNAFSISVSERTRQFGLLSSVGATKRQLRRSVLFEALTVGVIGIPLGVLAGIGGIAVTLLLVGDKFRSIGFDAVPLKLHVSPVSVVIAVVIATVTVLISAWVPSKRATKVSAVEAIRQNADVRVKGRPVKISRFTYRVFGLPGVLASKYYKRSRKGYRATILSLFMSVVLFVSAVSFTDYLTESMESGLDTPGYDILCTLSDSELDNVSPPRLLDEFAAADGVTAAEYSYFETLGEGMVFCDADLTDYGRSISRDYFGGGGEGYTQGLVDLFFVDDAAFGAMLDERHIGRKGYFDKSAPLGVAFDGVTRQTDSGKYVKRPFFAKDSFSAEYIYVKDIQGYTFFSHHRDKDDKDVYLYTRDEDGSEITLSAGEATLRAALSVGAVVDERPAFLRDRGCECLIFPESMRETILPGAGEHGSYFFTVRSSDHARTAAELKSVLEENGLSASSVYDAAESEVERRNLVLIVRVFSSGFVVLISLIAVANVFNTITTNIALRRRDFAMLRSVGMTDKGLNRMLRYECLLYGSKALLWGLPVSAAVSVLIYLATGSGFDTVFRLPFGAMVVAALTVFLVVFVTMMYAVAGVKKANISDALRNENL